MATGFGANPIGRIGGGDARVRPYVLPATDATIMGKGAFVELAGAEDAVERVPTIIKATAGHVLLGVIVGFQVDPTDPYNGDYRKASTRRVAFVCDDPDAIFEIQEDAVGGAVSAANVMSGANADIVVAAATEATRISGDMLDSSTAGSGSANLKILGVRRAKDDLDAAATAGAVFEVMILEHALRTADSIT